MRPARARIVHYVHDSGRSGRIGRSGRCHGCCHDLGDFLRALRAPSAQHAYPIWMLASSSDPLKYSEPGRAPIGTASVLAIEPMLTVFENVWPSTTSLTA